MERLGVGRTPVREASATSPREQLVEVFPRRGIFVSGVDIGDIAGLSEVRLVLESLAARLAAERRSDADREDTRGAARRADPHGGGANERSASTSTSASTATSPAAPTTRSSR